MDKINGITRLSNTRLDFNDTYATTALLHLDVMVAIWCRCRDVVNSEASRSGVAVAKDT
jgi:hypothetical protein